MLTSQARRGTAWKSRISIVLVWAFWAFGVSLIIYGWGDNSLDLWGLAMLGLGGLAFGVVGLALAIRASLPIGWFFLLAQVSMGLVLAGIITGTPVLIVLAAILLLFPQGGIPGRKWHWAAWALGAGLLVAFANDVVGWVDEDLGWLATMLLVIPVLVANAVRIINAYRRSRGEMRAQLKWLAWILLVGGSILLVSLTPIPYLQDAHNVAGLVLIVGAPIAIGVAITRYRLYEIDRIISRTVSYTVLVGLLAIVLFGLATVVSALVPAESDLAIAASTLAVAGLFNPVRKRIQDWVDRRFNRSRYDAQRVMDAFVGTLRDRVDIEDVVGGWVGAVWRTMQPASVGVWVRSSDS